MAMGRTKDANVSVELDDHLTSVVERQPALGYRGSLRLCAWSAAALRGQDLFGEEVEFG